METRSKSRKEGIGVHPNLLPSDQGVGEGQGGSSQVLPNPSTINDSRNSLVVGGETQNLDHTMPPTNLLSKAFSLLSKGGETLLNSFQKSPSVETQSQSSRATKSLPSQFLNLSGTSPKVSSRQLIVNPIASSSKQGGKGIVLASPLSSSSPRRPVSVLGRIFQRNKIPTASSSSYVPNTTANTFLPETPLHSQEHESHQTPRQRLPLPASCQQSLEWDNNDIVIEDEVFIESFTPSGKHGKHELLVNFRIRIIELYQAIENPTLVSNLSTFLVLEELSDLQDWIGKLPPNMVPEELEIVEDLEEKIPNLIDFFLSVHKNESSSHSSTRTKSSEVKFRFDIPKEAKNYTYDHEHSHSFSSPVLDNTVQIEKDYDTNSCHIQDPSSYPQAHQSLPSQIYQPFVDKKWFEQELVKCKKDLENKISSVCCDWRKELSHFSQHLESKFEGLLQDRISHESNCIKIKCIEAKNETHKSLLSFENAVVQEFKTLHENNKMFKESLKILADQIQELRSDFLVHINDSSSNIKHGEKSSCVVSETIVNDNLDSSKVSEIQETPRLLKPTVPKEIFPSNQCVLSSAHDSFSSTNDSSRLMSNCSRLLRKIQFCCQQINEIVQEKVNNTTSRARVIEIQSFDLITLRDLKKELHNLEMKAEKMKLEKCIELIDRTQEKIKLWESSVTQQQKAYHLHLSSEKNLLKSIDLPIFDGSPYGQTIYTFLSTFFRFAEKACSPADQALLIYTTYLSDPIKREVESFQDDINKIKDHLIDRYGDLRAIAESRLQAIASLRHPMPSSDQSQIDYYKKVYQSLLQVESLCQADLVNKNDIDSVIFTSTYVKQLVSNMPDSIIDSFSERIEKEKALDQPKGEFHFYVLKEIIEQQWKKLSTKSNIKFIKDGTTHFKGKSINVIDANEATTLGFN